MATDIDVILPHVLPDVSGCPAATARLAIIEAAIELCTKSGAWTEILDLVYTNNGTHSYELDLPKDSRALLITDVWAGSRLLAPKTMAELSRVLPDWQTAQGDPSYYNQQNWEELRVYPTPNNPASQALTVRAQLAPKRGATTFPDSLVDRRLQGIAAGALARLMLKPGQSWSNPQLAAFHQNVFLTDCGNARVEQFHERVQGSVRVTPRRFGG